jgi:hypothetical protein
VNWAAAAWSIWRQLAAAGGGGLGQGKAKASNNRKPFRGTLDINSHPSRPTLEI